MFKMGFHLKRCFFLTLTILYLYSTPTFCEILPKVDLQMSYQIPDDASKPMDLELTCDVNGQDGSDLLMLMDISISKRIGDTKRPVVLASIGAVTRKPVPVCTEDQEKSLAVSGHINPTRGSLKVELTIDKEDSQIYDYVCSVNYINSKLLVETVESSRSNSFIKLFSLLSMQNYEKANRVDVERKWEYLKEKIEELEKKCQPSDSPRNCIALPKNHPMTARQIITSSDGTKLVCDTITDGGGWTVFQRRINGNTNFYRGWNDYVNGFGDLNSNFWLGLKHIRDILKQGGPYELRVDFDFRGKSYYARYSTFDILDAATHYQLKVGGYSGTAGDSLSRHHNGMAFSTFDADHDKVSGNCASEYRGAWWYNHCDNSNLNGEWGAGSNKGPRWYHITVSNPATFTEMKFRPISR